MSAVDLDHTIVHVRDKHAAAEHLAWVLGLEPATTYGPFVVVRLSNGAALCLADSLGPAHAVHLAFLVSPDSFEEIRDRLVARRVPIWADPFHEEPGVDEARDDGGRGLYWDDPDGNTLEILTVPDGGWPAGHHRAPTALAGS
jgi:catechol 2,3-dioxygenase-like lactoylglutathione lyase family enzyme